MGNKVIVLGSNSFSGSNFTDHILQKGLKVIGISRSAEPHEVFLPYKKRHKSRFRFYQLDLNHDIGEIMKVVQSFMPDYIVNFAAQSMVAESWTYPEHWFQTNVLANVKFHNQLRKCEFLKKYIHVSTPEVYGNCQGVVKENTFYNPSTPYAVSRAAADLSLMSFYRMYNFPVVFTRSANVYGAGQQLYRIIPRTIIYFLIKKRLSLHGGGTSVRSFIHIRDVADGTFKAMMNATAGEIFHFSTSTNISILSLVQMISKKMGVPFEENVEVAEERPGKDSAYLLDSSKARRLLGWEDKISLEEGIEEVITWIKENLDVLKTQPLDYIHKP